MNTNDNSDLIPSLDQYLQPNKPIEEELSRGALFMEESLNIYNFPSFKPIFLNIRKDKELTMILIEKLNAFVSRHKENNDKLIEAMADGNKCIQAKNVLQLEMNKLISHVNTLKVKCEKMEQKHNEQKEKWEKLEASLKEERDYLNLSIVKLNTKDNFYFNEIRKKEALIAKLQERERKMLENHAKKSIVYQNNEIYASYCLNEKKSNGYNTKNAKEIFNEEMGRALSEKYQVIIKQNDAMKLGLNKLNQTLIDLTSTQRDSFLNGYKETFGFEFAQGQIDSSVNNEFDANNEPEEFIEQMNHLFVKLKEFVIRKEELSNCGAGVLNVNVRMNDADANGNCDTSSVSKGGNIDQTYLSNLKKINEYYKHLSNDMCDLLKKTVKTEEDRKVFGEVIKEIEERRKTAYECSRESIEYNSKIDLQLNKEMQIKKEPLINYEELKASLERYKEIISSNEVYLEENHDNLNATEEEQKQLSNTNTKTNNSNADVIMK